jgi:hypothetical protein
MIHAFDASGELWPIEAHVAFVEKTGRNRLSRGSVNADNE